MLSVNSFPHTRWLTPDSEMSPLCTESLKTSSLGTLDMGTILTCVKMRADATPPKNCLASWLDGEYTLHLLPQHDFTANIADQALHLQGEPERELIYQAGGGSAVWFVGNEVVCKVHAWKEGLDMESETIAFVRKHFPTIPVPEVLYEWVDQSMNRSFLIMERVHARTLEVAWPSLTQQQRLNIANEVAEYTALVATKTSTRYQTVSGSGVQKPWLMQGYDFDGPIHSWFPRTLGPLTGSELRAHWTKISTTPPPTFEDPLVLCHDDQGPTNVLISDSGDSVEAIIDWANVSYVPRFWVATVVLNTAAFRFESDYEDPKEWMTMLAEALKKQGFEPIADFRKWHDSVADYDTDDDKLEWSKVQLTAPSW